MNRNGGLQALGLGLALTLAVMPEMAMAENAVRHIELDLAPVDDDDFRQRLAQIRSYVDETGALFSASEFTEELTRLRNYTGDRSELLTERREVLSMLGSIASRSPSMPWEAALEPLGMLMALDGKDDRPLERQMLDHYVYAGALGDYAAETGDIAKHRLSAEQYGQAAALAERLDEYDDDQRLGIYADQAYQLHEAQLYEQALEVNMTVLSRKERLDQGQMGSVHVNIAQNLYSLGRLSEVEAYLIRAQEIAEADDDLSRVQNMLFQRGVLAFDLGEMDRARALMQERIERLAADGEPDWLDIAREDYEELERRITAQ